VKLPRYIHSYYDRHGQRRWYFRRRGFKKVRLRGLPGSEEFTLDYERALAGQPLEIGSKKVRPGTIHAVALSYFNSFAFRTVRPSSQKFYRSTIERFCRATSGNGMAYGDMPVAGMGREHVVRLMLARKPSAANNLRKALRALMTHAVEINLRQDDPTAKVKPVRTNSGGIHSWTEAEIAQFEARHQVGTKARLALALLLGTGQRVSDVIRMGRQHIRDGFIHVRQQKTGAELDIEIPPELAAILADTPTNDMTFLMAQPGRPFTPGYFSARFCERCKEAGLSHCSAHGLRKASARRMADAECSPHEIAAITGHKSLAEVQRYTQGYNQRRLASSAMAKLAKAKNRTSSG